VATEESNAHSAYKRKLVELNETAYTDVFGRARWPGAPHRVLQTPFYKEWRSLPAHENETNQPVIGHSTINGVVCNKTTILICNCYVMSPTFVFDYTFCTKQDKDIRRFAGTVPNMTTTGDLESMVMFAGEGVGLIKEILPAGEVVKQLVEGAQLIIKQNLK